MLNRIPSRIRIPFLLAAIAFLIHLVCNLHYGFHGDELYFIICGQHPQWNYVDQPLVAPLLAAASQMFGSSLVLLRAVPALFAGAGIYVTCLIVLELGGAAYAQFLSAIVVFFLPVLTDFGMKLHTDMVGLWSWPLLTLWIVRLTKGANSRLWIAIGVLMGVSILSKYSVLFFCGHTTVGALTHTGKTDSLFTLVRRRGIDFRHHRTAVVLVAGPLWIPDARIAACGPARQERNRRPDGLPWTTSLAQRFPCAVLDIGLIWLFFRPAVRFLAYGYVLLIAIMIVLHGKHYYPADVYPYLIAAGCVQIEHWTSELRRGRIVIAAATVLLGLAFFPLVMPVLPEAWLATYHSELLSFLRISRQNIETEHRVAADLPGDFASMHGWTELTAIVNRVYKELPPADQKQAVVLAQNYSQAAAIEFLSKPKLPAISGHNQYFLWGPRGYSGDVLICVGANCDSVSEVCRTCSLEATQQAPWIYPSEYDIPIMVCRGIKRPISELWPLAKFYN